ncbi:hypothetical protein JCM8208_000681 [Rhodotorula glutinis]
MSDEPLSLELAALIASLHLSDLATLDDSRKGKARHGEVNDEECACALYAKELEAVEQVEADRRFALSFETAGHADGPVLDELSAQEEVASHDHEIAVAVSRGRTLEQARRSATASRSSSCSASTRASRSTSLTRPSTSSPSPGPDAPPVPPLPSTSGPRAPCVICNERVASHSSVTAPCADQHTYCAECLCALFRAATRDESLFPPRCDGVPIPVALVTPFLSSADLATFKKKAIEFSTPDRLYCATATCSAFLGPTSETKRGVECGSCGAQTCEACKAPWYGLFGLCGASGDDEAAALLERDMQFRRCPGCRRVVELDTGCFHMTCLCSTQFCYLCAAPWKTCTCPQWDEDRLVRAAEARVQAQAPHVAPAPARVERMVERLRENHECAHRSWGLRPGGGQCQSCYYRLERYLLRCRGCEMVACVRCQRNRL